MFCVCVYFSCFNSKWDGKEEMNKKRVNNKINFMLLNILTLSLPSLSLSLLLFLAWILNHHSIHFFVLRIAQVGKSIRLQNYTRNSADHFLLLLFNCSESLLTHNGISLENDDISIDCIYYLEIHLSEVDASEIRSNTLNLLQPAKLNGRASTIHYLLSIFHFRLC